MFSMTPDGLQGLVDGLTRILLDASAKTFLLLTITSILALVFRKRSAAQRHMIWSMGLFLALAMPLLSGVVPSVEIPLPFQVENPAVTEAMSPNPELNVLLPPIPFSDRRTTPIADADPSTKPIPESKPSATRSGLDADPSLAGSVGSGEGPRLQIPSLPLLLAVWVLGGSVVLVGLILSLVRLVWITRRTPCITEGRILETAGTLTRRLGLKRNPILLRGKAGTVPMTWGILAPVLLIPGGAERWPPDRLEAVLLHELGHFRRRDYLSQVAAQIACALYWFNPLAWVAAHRMWIEREHACDDLVVAAGLDAPRYADDLVSLARSLRGNVPAGAMAFSRARTKRLRDRLLAILDEGRSRSPITRGGVAATGILTLALACGLAALSPASALEPDTARTAEEADSRFPVFETQSREPGSSPVGPPFAVTKQALTPPEQAIEPSVLCGPADGEAHRRTSHTDDDRRTVEAEYGDCRSSIDIRGEIRFTSDFSGIVSLASEGRMRIEVERSGSEQRLDVSPGSGGRPEYTWLEGGRTGAFGPEQEEWLTRVLLELFRSTDYMARERADWIMSQEGPEGIFSEVLAMHADHAKATYLTALLEEGDLSAQQVRETLDLAGREIDSDHSRGEILKAMAAGHPFDGPTRDAFLQAATSVQSDHTQGEIFLIALSRGDLSPANLETLLDTAAESIESDHTLSQILIEAARHNLSPADLREAFLRAAASVGSDHSRGQVYRAALGLEGLTDVEMADILRAAGDMGSDHDLSTLLVEISGPGLPSPSLRKAYLAAASRIDSDHSLSEALRAFARMDDLQIQDQVEVLEAAQGIGSDHSLAEFLLEFAGKYPVRGEVRDAFLRTLEEVGSSFDRDRVADVISGMGG